MKKIIFLLISLTILLAGCPPAEDGNGDEETIGIVGYISYAEEEDIAIAVLEDDAMIWGEDGYMGTLIPDATVTINDIELPFDSDWGYVDDGTLITLTPGESYTVKIVCNEKTFEQTIVMPPAPTITSHDNGAAWNEGAATMLTWTLPSTDHDQNEVFIFYFDTQSGEDYRVLLPAATTSHSIPAGTLLGDVAYLPGIGIYVTTREKYSDFGSDYVDGSFILFTYEEYVGVNTAI
ncbi:MAG: hypothetical protein JXB88_14645 [Spirochaetales bacterium]|nr:hypothetical protein [Spirochaetales bacterium]